jgi:hypothetical protein
MKIRPLGAELLHADRRTHMKLIVAFHKLRTRLEMDLKWVGWKAVAWIQSAVDSDC